jgi:hypothetical protein
MISVASLQTWFYAHANHQLMPVFLTLVLAL